MTAGPWAIEAYVEDPAETRFIQSFKSFAAQESFTETDPGPALPVRDLLSAFLLKVREHGGGDLAELPERVVVGRPVRFVGGAPTRPWRCGATKRLSTGWG